MNEHQFYLTLPSNSSAIYYPENTVANYKTQLPKNVQLPGAWEVAVVEVHFPYSFLTVDDDAIVFVHANIASTDKTNRRVRREADAEADADPFILKLGKDSLKLPLVPGTSYYQPQLNIGGEDIPPPIRVPDSPEPKTVQQLPMVLKFDTATDIPPPPPKAPVEKVTRPPIKTTTKQRKATKFQVIPTILSAKLAPGNYGSVEEVIDALNTHEKLVNVVSFEYDTKKVELKINETVDQVEMSHRLALMLGFDPGEDDLKTNNKSIRPANLLLALPSQMYVYCDIVEPQLIGDTMAPLLQIINIDTTNYVYGANKCVQFSTPHYVPVMKSSFESLEIDLRDHTGAHLPFHFGTSCVKLHFRRIIAE